MNIELYDAILHNQFAKVRGLLKRGANPNLPLRDDHNNLTTVPLVFAIQTCNIEVVRLLLDYGANPNPKLPRQRHSEWANGLDPLTAAASQNFRDGMVILLLDRGAKINARDPGGNTPLIVSMGTFPNLVRTLIARGADVNFASRDGWTPLMGAATGDIDLLTLFLAHGARINARDKDGKTALMAAACHGFYEDGSFACSPEGIRFLVAHGAQVNIRDKHCNTVLMWLGFTNPFGEDDTLRAARDLLAHGARVDYKNSLGQTALQIAKKNGHNRLAKLLRRAMNSHTVGGPSMHSNSRQTLTTRISAIDAKRAMIDCHLQIYHKMESESPFNVIAKGLLWRQMT